VVGAGLTGLAGTIGLALDGSGKGQPGTNFATRVTWLAFTVPGTSPAVSYVGGGEQPTGRRFVPHVASVVRASMALLPVSTGRVLARWSG
jgi:hypothetical protein